MCGQGSPTGIDNTRNLRVRSVSWKGWNNIGGVAPQRIEEAFTGPNQRPQRARDR